MSIAVEELNGTNCKTYLLSAGGEAILVDPVREHVPTYVRDLAARGLKLVRVLETHMHADHLMLSREDKRMLGAEVVMHRMSPSPLVDRHVDDGDSIELSGIPITYSRFRLLSAAGRGAHRRYVADRRLGSHRFSGR